MKGELKRSLFAACTSLLLMQSSFALPSPTTAASAVSPPPCRVVWPDCERTPGLTAIHSESGTLTLACEINNTQGGIGVQTVLVDLSRQTVRLPPGFLVMNNETHRATITDATIEWVVRIANQGGHYRVVIDRVSGQMIFSQFDENNHQFMQTIWSCRSADRSF